MALRTMLLRQSRMLSATTGARQMPSLTVAFSTSRPDDVSKARIGDKQPKVPVTGENEMEQGPSLTDSLKDTFKSAADKLKETFSGGVDTEKVKEGARDLKDTATKTMKDAAEGWDTDLNKPKGQHPGKSVDENFLGSQPRDDGPQPARKDR